MGLAPFEAVHEQMLSLLQAVRQAESPGAILLVEHDPVYTAGRATPRDELAPEIRVVERGGRITYHGPGQLVVYPIVPLPRKDIRHWMRALERFGIAICAHFDLQGTSGRDGAGVFVGGRKVASIGVAIRHWINLHGIAVNVDMDLGLFERVRPCGLDPAIMSDLSREVGRQVTMDEAKQAARSALPELLAGE